LTCHKQVCDLPGPCQVRESEKCVTGGGPPRCPAVINAPDGTSCNDANICTVADHCAAGICGGAPATCSSSSDTCDPSSGCATTCGADGCVVSAAGGEGDPTLTVPAGALSADVRITMADLGPDPNDASVSHVYEFDPDGTTFATPANVNLPAPAVAAGHTVVIEVADALSGPWTEIATTVNAGRATGNISHFSFCRTRDKAPTFTTDLHMVDMVQYFDVTNRGVSFPPTPDGAACAPGTSLHGVCFKFKNVSPGPFPGPTTARVNLWQCYNSFVELNFTDPVTGQFEGAHCYSTSLLIPCGFVDLPITFPTGPLASGAETIRQYTVFPPSDTVAGACFGSAFIGVDITFKEPTTADPAVGMRSAKVGPFVDFGAGPVPFQGIFPLSKHGNTVSGIIKNFLIDARE